MHCVWNLLDRSTWIEWKYDNWKSNSEKWSDVGVMLYIGPGLISRVAAKHDWPLLEREKENDCTELSTILFLKNQSVFKYGVASLRKELDQTLRTLFFFYFASFRATRKNLIAGSFSTNHGNGNIISQTLGGNSSKVQKTHYLQTKTETWIHTSSCIFVKYCLNVSE